MTVVPVGKIKFAGTPVRVIVTEPPHAPASVADAVPNSSSKVEVHDDVVTETLGGTVRVGGVVSLPEPAVTVTVCVHEATVPVWLSLAVHVMSVLPAGNGSVNGRPSLRSASTETSLSLGFDVGVPMVEAGIVASQLPDGAGKVTLAGHEIVTGCRLFARTVIV
jgi:hypothetical protein